MEDHEELDYVASEHDHLINAITKLDKTQHITEPTRNEPTNFNSEFNLIKRSNKVKLSNVVKVLEDTAHHVKIGKKLRISQDSSKILPKPLEKPQADRIKRTTGYDQAKQKITKWDPVVARNRTVDFVSFPLKPFSTKLQPTKDFISKLKLKSPLEIELEEVDPPSVQEVKEDDEHTYPMSYQEMLEHRQNLAKFRAQQSYKAAKAKRQSKIKSKKYHRILKKEKLKKQLKEFEELQNSNPEEALKKLEELEKARALERHTLRHKSTGKWAKNKLVRAKYDKEVRQELAEQLSVSRSLTKKTQNTESTDDEEEDNGVIPDITLAQDPMNPWMMKRSDKTNIDADFNFGYKKYVKDKMIQKDNTKQKVDSESDSDEEESKNLMDDDSKVDSFRNLKKSIQKLTQSDTIIDNNNLQKKAQHKPKKVKSKKLKVENVTATSSWVVNPINVQTKEDQQNIPIDISSVFDTFDTKVVGKVEKKLKHLRKVIDKIDPHSSSNVKKSKSKEKAVDNLEYLKLKKQNVKPIIDEELLETTTKEPGEIKIQEKITTNMSSLLEKTNVQDKKNMDIDPSRFIEVKPKFLNSALSKNSHDLDDLDDEQVVPKVDIGEVFEEDDVVASFRQEKEDEIQKDNLVDVELTLPGWGSWGGKGVKAPKRKKNRFISKLPPKVPRRDENKGDIIIYDFKDPKLATHKVTDLPFPFTSVKDYEASIRTPLGNTFIPEKAHKKLIRPSLITKAGSVIEPMDEEELLVPRNKTFKNEAIIKLLAKK